VASNLWPFLGIRGTHYGRSGRTKKTSRLRSWIPNLHDRQLTEPPPRLAYLVLSAP